MQPPLSVGWNSLALAATSALVLLSGLSPVSGRVVQDVSSDVAHIARDNALLSPELAAKRIEYDNTVRKWKRDNPHLVSRLSDDEIESLWDRMAETDPANPLRKRAEPAEEPLKAPVYKRVAPNAAQVSAALSLFNKATEELNARNVYISANPRRNQYTLKGASGNETAEARKRDAEAPSFIVTDELREAAALLAELDAEEQDRNGTLYREYRLAYKDTPDGEIKYRTQKHGQLSKRAGGYWLADLGKQNPGRNPFGGAANSNYAVFRNVKDFGAVGDGKKDDTAAINKAIADGNRCGKGCGSSSVKGATVYFPPGTYLVSGSIIAMYHTQLVGDPDNPAVLLASPYFTDLGVISANIYTGVKQPRWGADKDDEWYLDTGNFFRQVRNFVIDISAARTTEVKGLHWQVAQATSLQNVHVKMKAGSTQIGAFIENGSGGFFSDLTFEGGQSGILCGNQQFTSRALIFQNCKNAITMLWDWGWIWKGLDITGGEVGINFTTGDFPGGSLTVLDSKFSGVKTGVVVAQTPKKSDHQATVGLMNIQYSNVGNMVDSRVSGAKMAGGSGTISSWFIGNTYKDGNSASGGWTNGGDGGATKVPDSLRYAGASSSGYFARSKEQYSGRSDWIIPTAKGDGKTDDTAALSLAFTTAAQQKRPIFLPTGSYIITDTITISPNTIIVGMCWSQFVASGKNFQDAANPRAMIRVGKPGDTGKVELSDLLFTGTGPTAGLVAVEWNIKADDKGSAAMWDSHVRIGGAAGTNLQVANCPKLTGVKPACIAGSMLVHLTKGSSAYLENVWAWTADHDLDDPPSFSEAQVDIYVARGILIESTDPTWLWGTASEHNVFYQYALVGAKNVFMGLIQTESPYYLPTPSAPAPFDKVVGKFPGDPDFAECKGDKSCMISWGLRLVNSQGIFVVGAGLYSWFFDNYGQTCIEPMSCQKSLLSVDEPSTLSIYNLFTVGTKEMVSPKGGTTLLAKDNQMLIGKSPWTSTIASWTKQDSLNIVMHASNIDPSFWTDIFPAECKGIDKCPSKITNGDSNALNLEATKNKGYLCLLDWMYKNCTANGVPREGWDRCLFGLLGFPSDTCQSMSSLNARCPTVSQQTCTSFQEPAVYWLISTLGNFAYRNQALVNMAFFQSYLSTLTDVYAITDKITDAEDKQGLGIKKILKIISQVLGFVGAAAPHLPIPPKLPTVPGGKEGDRAGATGEVIDVMSMVFDTSQEHLKEDEDKKYDLHKQMEMGLGTFLNSTEVQLTQNLVDFFQYGKLDNWSASVFPDASLQKYNGKVALTSPVAKYLADQRFINPPAGDEDQAIEIGMHEFIKTGLIMLGLAESGTKYYILRNPVWMVDCNKDKHKTARQIDGNCYVLHHPSIGWRTDMPDVTDSVVYTKEIDDSFADILPEQNLLLLYQGSIACQSSKNEYTPVLDGSDPPAHLSVAPSTDNPLGSCIFSLPIIYVEPKETGKPHESSPCIVLDRAKKGGDSQVGFNILPEFLKDTFTDKFCQIECRGKSCNTMGCPPPPQKCAKVNLTMEYMYM